MSSAIALPKHLLALPKARRIQRNDFVASCGGLRERRRGGLGERRRGLGERLRRGGVGLRRRLI